MPSERLAIAQVTPFAWETPHEVNTYIARVSDELAGRGHRVLIIAPSQSSTLVRESRRAIRSRPEELLARAEGAPVVLGVGEVLPFSPTTRRTASLPVDVARTIEEALRSLTLDLVHVHEPFAPSASSVALRHSRALNVGTFHAPTERFLSTQLTGALSRLFFARLDVRTADYTATRDLMRRFFPSEYQVIAPGADVVPAAGAAPGADVAPVTGAAPGADVALVTGAAPGADVTLGVDRSARGGGVYAVGRGGPVKLAMIAVEERAATRAFLRALRLLPADRDWRATVWSPRPLAAPATLARALRERVRFVDAGECSEAQVLAGADIAVLGSEGIRPVPACLTRALAAGVVPVASRLPVYEEVLLGGEDGEAGAGDHAGPAGLAGLVFEPGDVETLAAHLVSLISTPELLAALRDGAAELRSAQRWSRVTDELEDLFARLVARRHSPGDGVEHRRLRSRLAPRPLIDVDLHMHTDHSYDCATPVEVLLAQARARGLGAIAITDHNEVSGAHEARAKASGASDLQVIVAEEVKTADQGEVIGLFIEEQIPRGMTLQATIAEIKRQGGLVYVPHPFDRMHSVPDYEHLLDVLDDVDAIEIFNPRVAISEFNDEAVRFAAKYRIPAGAGSDAHVPQGLGSVRIRMRAFEGPQEFLESLRDADILRNPASLLYVQALKFLQTKALPESARRASRDRRVRRVTGRDRPKS